MQWIFKGADTVYAKCGKSEHEVKNLIEKVV